MNDHDEKIIEHIRSALILLAENYKDNIARHCQSLLRCDTELAEEFAIKAFLEIPKRIYTSNGKESLKLLLYQTATSLCDEHFYAIRLDAWNRDNIRDQLSQHENTILFLRDIEGFTFSEIGSILGSKGNTIQAQYRNAKNRYNALKGQQTDE